LPAAGWLPILISHMALGWRGAAAAMVAAAGVFLLLTAETDLTYYDRIGVPEDAELSAIKKAYRTKAMQLHPDKNIGEKHWLQQWWAGDDTHRFSRLVEAHDCLVDEECRAKYNEEIRGVAREEQMHWSDRWALRRRAKEAQWQQAWASVESPRELVLLALHSLQEAVVSVPDWLPGLLTPRGLIRGAKTAPGFSHVYYGPKDLLRTDHLPRQAREKRKENCNITMFAGTFFLLIFLLSVEIVLKPALQLLWLPARMLRWLLLELSGQRRRNDASREAKKAEARQRQQAQVQKWTSFLKFLMINHHHLPRQARDKHDEN
jgi:hypothetical protein